MFIYSIFFCVDFMNLHNHEPYAEYIGLNSNVKFVYIDRVETRRRRHNRQINMDNNAIFCSCCAFVLRIINIFRIHF